MLIQKLYRNGNSVAVTIPKEYLKALNLRDGSLVVVKRHDQAMMIVPKAKLLAQDVDSKFMKMVDEFISDHQDVLQKLATK